MYINIFIVYLTTLSVDCVPSNEKLTNEVLITTKVVEESDLGLI